MKYNIGDRVKTIDEDTGELARGTVMSIDKKDMKILWDDISEECDHFTEDRDIKPIKL